MNQINKPTLILSLSVCPLPDAALIRHLILACHKRPCRCFPPPSIGASKKKLPREPDAMRIISRVSAPILILRQWVVVNLVSLGFSRILVFPYCADLVIYKALYLLAHLWLYRSARRPFSQNISWYDNDWGCLNSGYGHT
ncbi:hypothetical protein HYPSUDRAFT_997865 [Hypholoma sublateritium FD-334 SS-4]|uniref:Uncharacterized protein n=1 Tax=Hypholoma sublateritium (strain FD-334 SS-4) TaxID=945553 RepID=A0A0D2PC23_HYPSF|nr:hypothetical protein HYPSUDRAFT_997865 [Hypholoma sublateritium FD-334 SS-4]